MKRALAKAELVPAQLPVHDELFRAEDVQAHRNVPWQKELGRH
jgi:hypothetical protein